MTPKGAFCCSLATEYLNLWILIVTEVLISASHDSFLLGNIPTVYSATVNCMGFTVLNVCSLMTYLPCLFWYRRSRETVAFCPWLWTIFLQGTEMAVTTMVKSGISWRCSLSGSQRTGLGHLLSVEIYTAMVTSLQKCKSSPLIVFNTAPLPPSEYI